MRESGGLGREAGRATYTTDNLVNMRRRDLARIYQTRIHQSPAPFREVQTFLDDLRIDAINHYLRAAKAEHGASTAAAAELRASLYNGAKGEKRKPGHFSNRDIEKMV